MDFNIREADWNVDAEQLSNIRRLVFIVEQKVPQEAEWDGRDDSCWHWLATDLADLPMGTCRLLPDGQIGRMAVLSNYRRRGIGAALLRTAIEKARHLGFSNVYLHAQTHAIGFYQQLGFKKNGQEFVEAGIPHYQMTQGLKRLENKLQLKAETNGNRSKTSK